jgi:ABC-type protease/lipase transport system fused ATPase/permease subunit
LAVLKHVDRIMMLENGRVVLDGPKDKVIEHLNNKAKA